MAGRQGGDLGSGHSRCGVVDRVGPAEVRGEASFFRVYCLHALNVAGYIQESAADSLAFAIDVGSRVIVLWNVPRVLFV